MPKYTKCPRCDLNYILEGEDYCEICKKELRGIIIEEPEDDEDSELCPVCGINFLNEGEKICEACAAAKEQSHTAIDDVEIEKDWEDDETDVDSAVADDEDMEISLEDYGDEEEEEEDEFEGEKPFDEEDFDEEIDYDELVSDDEEDKDDEEDDE